jgi:regulator of replication initiation timing
MNKKIALSIVLIAIVALALATWFVHNQISELQNQISELQAQNSDLQNQIKELQAQNSELQDQNTELQNQTSELKKQLNDLQNQTYRGLNVEITAFEWIGGFHPVVGLLIESNANVTVQNNEAYAIGGLRLNLKLVHISTGAELGLPAVVPIDTLQAGESREIKGWAFWDLGESFDDAECVVVLSLGDFVVDEWRETIWSPLS